MHIIKGLILKDLLNLQKYLRIIIMSLVFICAYGFFMKGMEFYLSFMPVMIIGMSSLSTFNYDELSKANRYLLALPTTRTDIVKARFLLIISLTLAATIISALVVFATSFMTTGQIPDITSIAFNSSFAFIMLACLQSVQIPCVYQWGSEKGRIIMMILFALFGAIFAGSYFLLQQLNLNYPFSSFSAIYGLFAILLIGAALYYFSYLISKRIFSKKEL